MTNEVRKALIVIFQTCLKQDACKNCPLGQICGKMPCEWEQNEITDSDN